MLCVAVIAANEFACTDVFLTSHWLVELGMNFELMCSGYDWTGMHI